MKRSLDLRRLHWNGLVCCTTGLLPHLFSFRSWSIVCTLDSAGFAPWLVQCISFILFASVEPMVRGSTETHIESFFVIGTSCANLYSQSLMGFPSIQCRSVGAAVPKLSCAMHGRQTEIGIGCCKCRGLHSRSCRLLGGHRQVELERQWFKIALLHQM